MEYTITNDDLDLYKHVNHARYLTIFEDCRWAFGEEIGFDKEFVLKEKKGIVITDLTIQYLREAKLGDSYSVTLEVELLDNDKVAYHHTLINKKNNKLHTKEVVTGVVMDLETRRKIPIPDIFLNAAKDYLKKKDLKLRSLNN